ncbi:hypothetical protein PFISCL1PPCAC_16201 [Pristionchus fissidentatus]|uniref:DUF1279 domain-containing protein n=1 Tax=Pristionchus fissidentatus TaxID=1538716 RepID=A0AAV5VZ49_9BILA|nr:hypothetical protein PFISCL1PPCAC_16201 [Pristionchus fissidentatus]
MRSALRLVVREFSSTGRFQPKTTTFLLRASPSSFNSCHDRPIANQFIITNFSQHRCLHLSRPCTEEQQQNDKKKKWNFHMTMTDEQKVTKKENIDKAALEEAPPGLFGKVKYYLKRYWYIAVPAHMVSCTSWFIILYIMVHSGVDVPALLETLYMPEWIIQKVKETPASAGVFVVAAILYKIALPLRYVTTLGLIQATFWGLRRMGKLRTAREVEYKVRSDYELRKNSWGRSNQYNEQEGVRAYTRRKSEEYKAQLEEMKKLEKKAEKKD